MAHAVRARAGLGGLGSFLGPIAIIVTLLTASACGGGDGDGVDAGNADAARPAPGTDWDRDILRTDLAIDVSTMSGTATIELAGSSSQAASFEVGDLAITRVYDGVGDLAYDVVDGRLDLGLEASTGSVSVTIDYGFSIHNQFEGVMDSGLTLTWPYYCGNVFPCKSTPADGTEFGLTLTGVDPSMTAVFPTTIDSESPSYMLAWAIAPFIKVELGTTTAGTQIVAWHRPGEETATANGTAHLRDVFDWLEQNIGAYSFGNLAGSVSAKWGFGAYGGMEHHPLWHVSSGAMSDEEVHAHEAAHGWFGNGIRIACWEDFVLSEGTVTYLAARGLEEVAGTTVSAPIWSGYQNELNALQAGNDNKIAWPEGCNEIDILDGLFGSAPYMKGAFFYRAVEDKIGRTALDQALAAVYTAHVGKAARMQDMLDAIEAASGWDPTACALGWLRADAIPAASICQ